MKENNEYVYVKNSSDEEQVKKAEKKEAFKANQNVDDMRFILSNAQGRRVLKKYLEACGVFRTSFSENVNQTLFLEGQRNVGLMLLNDINAADPMAYVKMMNESKEGK
jgi:hypothetical protein